MNEKKLSLYIFGTGAMASIILPSLRLSKCNIIAFVDERPTMWNTEYMQRPVIGLQDMHIEQCDFLCIICQDAKDIANRLANGYAISQDKIVTIDIYDKLYKKTDAENVQQSPSEAMKEYLSPFPGFFEIVDMDLLANSPIARAWLVPKPQVQSSGKTKYCHNFLHYLNFEPSTIQPCCLSGVAHQIPSEFAYTGGRL